MSRAGSLLAGSLLVTALVLGPLGAYGQTSITSSGLGTRITREGHTYLVTGGRLSGHNLFHSFGNFSVGPIDIARFRNANVGTVDNVIGRVTGGSPSNISGTIDTLGYPRASFWLINPAGVVFGRGARLSVDGSVHVSTADVIRFDSGPTFYAVPDAARDRALSVANPVAFGFLHSNPAPITVRGNLSVPAGQTLSLVGGAVNIVGRSPTDLATLTANGGQVQIASVASAGDVIVSRGLRLVPGTAGGDITLKFASIDVGGQPAGTVAIRGGRFVATGSQIAANNLSNNAAAPVAVDIDITGLVRLGDGTTITTSALQGGRSGDIRIVADTIIVENSRIDTFAFGRARGGDVRLIGDAVTISGPVGGLFTTAAFGEGGRLVIEGRTVRLIDDAQLVSRTSFFSVAGGDIVIDTTALDMSGGAVILSRTSGVPGGDVIIRADGAVRMSGGAGILTVGNLGGSGDAVVGDITLNVDSLTMTDGAAIQSGDTAGRTGNISITARGSILIADGSNISSQAFAQEVGTIVIRAGSLVIDRGYVLASTSGGSRAGDVSASVGSLKLLNGGQIVTSSEEGATGGGGNIDIVARQSLMIAGQSADGEPITPLVSDAHSGLFSTAAGTGGGGRITIHAPDIVLADGGRISVETTGAGPAGLIGLQSQSLTMTSGSRVDSSTSGAGAGGTITVDVAGRLAMNSDAGFFSDARSSGAGGNIEITAREIRMLDGATISATSRGTVADSGGGGRIRVLAPALSLANGSEISVETTGTGSAGTIDVASENMTLSSHARVDSSTSGAGAGGTITVDIAGQLTIDGDAGFFSNARSSGAGGRVSIRAPTVSLTGGSQISVETTGPGSAGTIDLAAQNLTLNGGARVDSSTAGSGAGGDMTVDVAGRLTIDGGAGFFSDTRSTGVGGDITLRAHEIQMLNGATVSATSTGTADATAGNLTVVFGETFQLTNSNITTESARAPGGNIHVSSTGSLLYLVDSQIITSVRGGEGGGGDITIGTSGHPVEFLVLRNGGIHADAHGGPGGNIDIFAHAFFTNVPIETAVTASSALSTPGTINISAPITDVSGSLAELPAGLLEAAALLRASCAARLAEGKASSLVVAGREGVPREPGGLLSSALTEPSARSASSVPDSFPATLPVLRLSYFDRECDTAR